MVIWGKRQTDNPSCLSMSVGFPVRLFIIHFKRDVVGLRTINQWEDHSSQLILRAHLDVTNQFCLCWCDLVQMISQMLLDHIHKDKPRHQERMTRIHSETNDWQCYQRPPETIVPAATEGGSIIDEWNNSGHVKSLLWEFHQNDKQSGCIYYYKEGWKPLLWIHYTQQCWTSELWCPVRLKAFIEGPVCPKGGWNNSGHVKSRLWEFHQSDKQSGCIYYCKERWKHDCEYYHTQCWTSELWCPVRLKAFIWRFSMAQRGDGIIVDMWSHAFGSFTKVTNKVAVFATIWKEGKGTFSGWSKTSLGLSWVHKVSSTVVNLRPAWPTYTQQ